MKSTVYEKTIRIRSEHVDRSRTLRTSELLRLLQEVSIAHTEELGFRRDKTLDRGLLWVIARQSLRIFEMPAYDEEILIRSRPGERLHYFFPRFYEVIKNGRVIIVSQAIWMLISEKTRTFVDPVEYGILIPGDPDSPEVALSVPSRPPKDAELLFETPFRARFSQIDLNGHMNNTRYFDLIDDLTEEYISADPSAPRQPREITADYVSEIRQGAPLTVCGYRAGDSLFFTGTENGSGKVKFRIRIEERPVGA